MGQGEPGLPSIRDYGDMFDPERASASAGASQVPSALSPARCLAPFMCTPLMCTPGALSPHSHGAAYT